MRDSRDRDGCVPATSSGIARARDGRPSRAAIITNRAAGGILLARRAGRGFCWRMGLARSNAKGNAPCPSHFSQKLRICHTA